jgi:hypothetical protein
MNNITVAEEEGKIPQNKIEIKPETHTSGNLTTDQS